MDACAKDLDKTVPAIEIIVGDIKAKNWAQAIADARTLIQDVEGDLSNCKSVVTGPDGARLVAWVK